jgi:hypothetical protein
MRKKANDGSGRGVLAGHEGHLSKRVEWGSDGEGLWSRAHQQNGNTVEGTESVHRLIRWTACI